jgi:hypothetical protein
MLLVSQQQPTWLGGAPAQGALVPPALNAFCQSTDSATLVIATTLYHCKVHLQTNWVAFLQPSALQQQKLVGVQHV